MKVLGHGPVYTYLTESSSKCKAQVVLIWQCSISARISALISARIRTSPAGIEHAKKFARSDFYSDFGAPETH